MNSECMTHRCCRTQWLAGKSLPLFHIPLSIRPHARANSCYNFTIVARDTSRNLRLQGGDKFTVYSYRVSYFSVAEGVGRPGSQPTAAPTAMPTTASQNLGLTSMSVPSDTYDAVRFGVVTDKGTGTYLVEVCPVIAGLHE